MGHAPGEGREDGGSPESGAGKFQDEARQRPHGPGDPRILVPCPVQVRKKLKITSPTASSVRTISAAVSRNPVRRNDMMWPVS